MSLFATKSLGLPRILIGMVFFFNVQCALAFLFWPGNYAPAFELEGVPGRAVVQGIGLLFLMWNVPYAVALIHPRRNWVSLVEATLMQAVGFFGEMVLAALLPAGHLLLRASVSRFMLFDGCGLVLLLLCLLWINRNR